MNALDSSDFENGEGNSITRLHEEDRTENLYRSCCGNTSDKRLVVLLTQVSVSILVLGFSGAMLAFGGTDTDRAIYMSLMSSTISYWLGKNEDHK
jgi:hypothetical protein